MPSNKPVQALVRGLEILEAVNRNPQGASLAEIAATTGLRSTTAHNLVRTLAQKGYLARAERPVRYHTGPAVEQLIREYTESSLLTRCSAAMDELGARFPGADVILSEYLHGQVAVRLHRRPGNAGKVERAYGRTMHPYGSASGLLLQAFLSAEELAAFRQRLPFWEHGAHLWKTEAALAAVLDSTRQDRVAVPPLDSQLFVCAAPVLRPNHALAAVLGASMPAAAITEPQREALVQDLKETALRLSAEY